MLNSLPIPILLIGSDERVAAANADAIALLGGDMTGRHYVTALRQPALLEGIDTVLKGRETAREAPYLASDGPRETRYKVTIRSSDGDSRPMAVLAFLDVTDLQEAGQMRRDFVANVSHELRTPLTALLGFIETLRGPARDDAAARDRFLTIMEREAGRMNRLVRDLLSLSRVETQERLRPVDPVDLAALLRGTVLSLQPLANDKGISLEASALDTPVTIPGDADQLAQVFSNLVENAIKYSGSGARVSIALETAENDPMLRGPAVIATVEDNGPGFDPIHIPRLTERFYRIDTHRSRELGGTGLGLAIVKHIIGRHRGRLRIASEPGSGSRFSVILPMA